jgi:hypothetical protein
MADVPSATHVARVLADALAAAGISYAVGGAIAFGLWAPPRATNDVDLTLFLPLERLPEAFDALEQGGAVVDRAAATAQARDRGDFRATWSGMRVDVVSPSIPFYGSVERRVQDARLDGRPVRILSAEDLAVFKLLFFQPKDLLDLERMVAFRKGALDQPYVRRWLVDMVGNEDARVREWDRIVAAYGAD